MPEFNFAQALGLLSFALGVYCFFQKDDKKFKYIMLTVNFNNALHFALLGAWTAVIASIFSVFRTWLAIKTSNRLVAYFFIAVIFSFGIYVSDTWVDMFPVVGACIGTYALFCLRHIKMRIAFLCGALCWLTNNILVGSIGGTLLELTLLAVNLNTIYRLYIAPTKKPSENPSD